MSTIITLVCDRCDAKSPPGDTENWAEMEFLRRSGLFALEFDNHSDLCEACADSLAAWYVNPQQFRQLHDVAEATLLFHRGGAWEPTDAMKWAELTGAKEATSKTLCDAIRKALAHPEEEP